MVSELIQLHTFSKVSTKFFYPLIHNNLYSINSYNNFIKNWLILLFQTSDLGFQNEVKEKEYTYNLQTEVLKLLQEFREVLDAKTEEDTYNPRYFQHSSIVL